MNYHFVSFTVLSVAFLPTTNHFNIFRFDVSSLIDVFPIKKRRKLN